MPTKALLSCMLVSLFVPLGSVESGWATPPGVKLQFDVRARMRDGVELSADIWMPAEPGKFATILSRTPYMKTAVVNDLAPFYARQGYVFVIQDTRGRGDSGGEFDFFFADGPDGYDTVEWIAAQPWSNGRVGMIGNSYLGTVQWLAAREVPPHLTCIVPAASGGNWFHSRPYQGGAMLMAWALDWGNLASGRVVQQPNAAAIEWARVFKHRPALTMDDVMGRRMSLFWRKWLEHDTWDAYWKAISFAPEDYRKIRIPALHLTGWFDQILPGALSYWEGMRAHARENARQYLVIGPWTHGQSFKGGQGKVGEMQFSADSVLDMKAQHLAFLDHYLKGSVPRFDAPPVRIYVTGSNKWLQPPDYPPPQAQARRLYLRGGGKANSLSGDGRLSWEKPGDEPPDRYAYDPMNPAPSEAAGLSPAGTPWAPSAYLAVDQRAIERRNDVLVYSTEALREPLTVAGRPFVNLYAASDARDTDFMAKLVDVYPDGRAIHLGSLPVGVLRGRYRKSLERTELLAPNQAEQFRIELTDVAHTFLPGHRVRVEVTSSAWPYIFPNPNTGNPIATDTTSRVAQQTVHHSSQWASHVELPVIPTP